MQEEIPVSDPFFSSEYRDDPPAVIARMRQQDPVHYLEPLGAWIVTRYDLIHRLFTDENATNDPSVYEHAPAPPPEFEGSGSASLFSAPPEQHARMRRLVSKALTPRAVARMEGHVVEVIEQYARPLRGASGVVDLYNQFFEPIPNTVVSRITGIPAKGDDERRFRELGRATLSLINPFLTEEERNVAFASTDELRNWIRDMTVERRRSPREDLISDLAQAHDLDQQLEIDEIVSVITALIAAGTDTTVSGGVFSLRTLLHHPDVLEELRADRSLLPNAVLELLRYDFGPTDWLPRFAVRDFELEGRKIRQGQLLMLSFMGADRDPAVFPDPDRVDIRRDLTRLAIFGHGPHYCLGVNLARQELRCMLDAALDFMPSGSRLLEDEIKWNETIGPLFRGLESFPVEFATRT